MTGFDPEVPGQPAAPADELRARPRPRQQLLIRGRPEHRRLVTVRLDDRLDAGKVGKLGADLKQMLREVRTRAPTRSAASSARSFCASSLSVAKHDGSTPTIGICPVASSAAIV